MAQSASERNRTGGPMRHHRSFASRDHPYARPSSESGGIFGTIKSFVSRLILGGDKEETVQDSSSENTVNDGPVQNAFAPAISTVASETEQKDTVPVSIDEYREFLAFKQAKAQELPQFPSNTWVPPQPATSVVVPSSHKKLVPTLYKGTQPTPVPLSRVVPVMDKTSPARRAVAPPTWSQYRYPGDWTTQYLPPTQPSTGKRYRVRVPEERMTPASLPRPHPQRKRALEDNIVPYDMDGDMEDDLEELAEPRPSKRMRTDALLTPFSRVRPRGEVAMSVTSKDVFDSFKKSGPSPRYQFNISTTASTPSTSRSGLVGKRKRSASPPQLAKTSRRQRMDEYEQEEEQESEVNPEELSEESSAEVRSPAKKQRPNTPPQKSFAAAKSSNGSQKLPPSETRAKIPESVASKPPSKPTATAKSIMEFEKSLPQKESAPQAKATSFTFSAPVSKAPEKKPVEKKPAPSAAIDLCSDSEVQPSESEEKEEMSSSHEEEVSEGGEESGSESALGLATKPAKPAAAPSSTTFSFIPPTAPASTSASAPATTFTFTLGPSTTAAASTTTASPAATKSEAPASAPTTEPSTSAGFHFNGSLSFGATQYLPQDQEEDDKKFKFNDTAPASLPTGFTTSFTGLPKFGDPTVPPLEVAPAPAAQKEADESSDIPSSELEEDSEEERRKDAEMLAKRQAMKEQMEKDAREGKQPDYYIDDELTTGPVFFTKPAEEPAAKAPEESKPAPTPAEEPKPKSDEETKPVVPFSFAALTQAKASEKEVSKESEAPKPEEKEFNPPNISVPAPTPAPVPVFSFTSSSTTPADSTPATTSFSFAQMTEKAAATAPSTSASTTPAFGFSMPATDSNTPSTATTGFFASSSAVQEPAPFSFTASSSSASSSATSGVFVFGGGSITPADSAPSTSILSGSSSSAIASLSNIDFSSFAGNKSFIVNSKESLFTSDMDTGNSDSGSSAASSAPSASFGGFGGSSSSASTGFGFSFNSSPAASTPAFGGFGASSGFGTGFSSAPSQSSAPSFGGFGDSSSGGFGGSSSGGFGGGSGFSFGGGSSSSSSTPSFSFNSAPSAASSGGFGGFGGFGGNSAPSFSSAPAAAPFVFGSSGGNMDSGFGGGNMNFGGGGNMGDNDPGDFLGLKQESSTTNKRAFFRAKRKL